MRPAFEGSYLPTCVPARDSSGPESRGRRRRRRGSSATEAEDGPGEQPSSTTGRSGATQRQDGADDAPPRCRSAAMTTMNGASTSPSEQTAQAEEQLEEDAERQRDEPEEQRAATRPATAPTTPRPAGRQANHAEQQERAHRQSWLRRNPGTGSAASGEARASDASDASHWARAAALLGGGLAVGAPRRARDCAALLPSPRART